MKEHLLQIIKELSERSYFNDCVVELTINYDSIIGFSKKIFKDSIEEYNDIITSTSKVESYNLTLTREVGDILKYESDWQRTSFVFYSCDDETLDGNEFASFDFTTAGNTPRDNSLSIVGLQHVLNDKNEYKYNNLALLIELMVDLDKLIDKQQEQKSLLFKKFINLI